MSGDESAAESGGGAFRVAADQERCCGAGLCTLNVPEVFDQDDDEGLVVVLDPAPPLALLAAALEAAALCPSSAITVEAG